MKFIIFSRRLIEHVEPYNKPHIIISVRTPGDPEEVKLPVAEHTLASLRLQFFETYGEEELKERNQYHMQRGNAFTVDTGKYVLNFVERYVGKIEAILIHCDAGLARSPTIAYALSKTVFINEDNKFLSTPIMRNAEIRRELDKNPEWRVSIYEELTEKDVSHGGRLPTCFECIMQAYRE